MADDNNLQDQFRKFTKDIQYVLEKNMGVKRNRKMVDEIQRKQVEDLMRLEVEFKNTILKSSPLRSKEVYQKFIGLITIENQNILTARPYFREQAKAFSSHVTPALKAGNIKELQKYHINFNFIKFVRMNWKGALPPESEILYNTIEKLRNELIENNLPLAVSRAVQFDEKTPESQKERMDIINSACMGLISGIDKYKAETYTKVFRSVCIGRMSGNMVDTYSETSLHFYPSDKKILYKANILRSRKNARDMEHLLELINEDLVAEAKEKKTKLVPVTLDQLNELMNAQSTISADTTEDEDGANIFSYTADPYADVEKKIIKRDMIRQVGNACSQLDIIEIKVLKLKGVSL